MDVVTLPTGGAGQTAAGAQTLRILYLIPFGRVDAAALPAVAAIGGGGLSRAPGSPTWARIFRMTEGRRS